MRKLLVAATVAAAGLLPLTAMAAGSSSSQSSQSGTTGKSQSGTTGQSQSGTTGQSQSGTTGQSQSGTTGQAGTSGQAGMAGDSKSWSDAKPIQESDVGRLMGRSVTSSKGDEIGRIDSVVTGGDGKNYAVMDVGRFLAIGEKSVAVPLDHLRMSDGDVVMMSPEGEGQLESQPEYQSGQHQPYQSGGMSGSKSKTQ